MMDGRTAQQGAAVFQTLAGSTDVQAPDAALEEAYAAHWLSVVLVLGLALLKGVGRPWQRTLLRGSLAACLRQLRERCPFKWHQLQWRLVGRLGRCLRLGLGCAAVATAAVALASALEALALPLLLLIDLALCPCL